MAGPVSSRDEYLAWQGRLKSYESSGLTVTDSCLQEGVSRTAFYRWAKALKGGVAESVEVDAASSNSQQSEKSLLALLQQARILHWPMLGA